MKHILDNSFPIQNALLFYETIDLSTRSIKSGTKMPSLVETEDETPKKGKRKYIVFKRGAKLIKIISSQVLDFMKCLSCSIHCCKNSSFFIKKSCAIEFWWNFFFSKKKSQISPKNIWVGEGCHHRSVYTSYTFSGPYC